jgi:peptidoglycan/LPS O-acetylase OafA/YrhL
MRDAIGTYTKGLSLFVDLFFVMSGFIIAAIYGAKVGTPSGYAKFLQRRVARLVPLHWLTLALSMLLWVGFGVVGAHSTNMPEFGARCIAKTVFLLHASRSCPAFNGQSWSISAEMAMYLMFPLVVIVAARSAKAVGVVAVILTGIAVAVSLLDSAMRQMWLQLHAVIRALPSFWIGAALYYNRSLLQAVPAPDRLLWIFSAGLIVTMMTGVPEIVILALVYIVAVLAIAADVQKRAGRLVSSVAPLGQLTYSLYMWHGMIILVMMNAIGDKLLHLPTIGAIAMAAACYAVLFGVSYVSFFYLETPARRWVDKLPLDRFFGRATIPVSGGCPSAGP